ncbi:cyclic nucleotide-binding domain-containing protein [Ghiorsea bivora]|uniref:cyclic nucleotide-binding domain-containing protein n=1 Tax=Ghiorsea bivora TaxID=1485545 RepID=UPI00056E4E8F|nr:cyclic nucleotide-binding domain-containing protein [Ghiorsea bivora]
MTERQQTSRKKLKGFCASHPNPLFLTENLRVTSYNQGMKSLLFIPARIIYQIPAHKHPEEMQGLINKFRCDVISSHETPIISENYTPLAKTLSVLKYNMRKVHLHEGAMLLKKGDYADYVYLILKGDLVVSSSKSNNLSLLYHLHAGSLLGKVALNKLMDVYYRFRERIRDKTASFSTQATRIMSLQETSSLKT